MKKIIACLLICVPLFSFAQYEDIAPGWEKDKERVIIIAKMQELINLVSFEMDCHKSEISYLVTEKYTFYKLKKDDHNFPKKVIVRACRESYVYLNLCPANGYGDPKDWSQGKWTLIPAQED